METKQPRSTQEVNPSRIHRSMGKSFNKGSPWTKSVTRLDPQMLESCSFLRDKKRNKSAHFSSPTKDTKRQPHHITYKKHRTKEKQQHKVKRGQQDVSLSTKLLDRFTQTKNTRKHPNNTQTTSELPGPSSTSYSLHQNVPRPERSVLCLVGPAVLCLSVAVYSFQHMVFLYAKDRRVVEMFFIQFFSLCFVSARLAQYFPAGLLSREATLDQGPKTPSLGGEKWCTKDHQYDIGIATHP